MVSRRCRYGGGALAAPSVRDLFIGIERADSITIDPHKWMFSPYDCGAVIYKDIELAKNAHSQKGAYLDIFKDEGAQGFNPSDYQIQLTRRLRGLPLWFSLAMCTELKNILSDRERFRTCPKCSPTN